MYPFQFKLSEDLPSSYPINGNPSVFSAVRIIYRIKAEVHGLDFPKAKNFQMIDICEILKRPIALTQGHIDVSVSRCCFFGGGDLKMTGFLDKNAYRLGETVNLLLNIDSRKCTVDMNPLTVRFHHFHIIGPEKHKLEVGKYVPAAYFGAVTGQAVPSGKLHSIPISFQVPEDANIDSNYEKTFRHLNNELEVVLNATCMNPIILKIPITLYALPAANGPPMPLPSDKPVQYLHIANLKPEMFMNY